MDLRGAHVLIVGLKRSGVAAAKLCAEKGARLTVSDSAERAAFSEETAALRDINVEYEFGGHRVQTFLQADLIVASPGVSLSIEPLGAARNKGIEVISELELASRFIRGRVVAITGSNGKTTTTALTGDVLRAAGFHTLVGGNIGTPLASLVPLSTEESVIVAEVSSFQLEAIPTFRPFVGVVLNVTPDHLDRYSSFEEYVSFKRALFKNQTGAEWAVLNRDDPITARFAPDLQARVWWFSQQALLEDGTVYSDHRIEVAQGGVRTPVIHRPEIPLLGAHNVENCLAAVSAAAILGADFRNVARAITEFPGVEHRLEFLTELKGVKYYNDSKATNVDATRKALEAFEGNVVLILGGKDKGSDYTLLSPLLKSRVKTVLLIGSAAGKIEGQLKGVVAMRRCETLQHAVEAAPSLTAPGDVVLLAPACASFDQFENYEHRGRVFKELVWGLKGKAAPG
ncbi:MAG: UDP-N-acetylmuramoyl-L-alanine--D-glutamate ligase [Acidobacteriia bacterium]|nr:UDP-N-acetylmuramoyl-L-alanine--D-glutamate ligase [Terriglobia bacterium]